MEKVCSLISDQFAVEVEQKENEIELIDGRISDVQSMLHKLRNSMLLQYYGLTDAGPETRSDRVKSEELRFAVGGLQDAFVPPPLIPASGLSSVSMDGDSERHTAADGSCADGRASQGPSRMGSGSSTPVHSHAQKRIIVGNTSRFIPEDQREVNDQSTHKWMVYVRGSREQPDIDPFVSKVWFFLHPSYKPNDIVEVTQAPFHLTRRGWGEFPIRVRLFLRDKRFKPVEILHSLRLDRTYTGLQTLNAETSVNLELDRQALHLPAQGFLSSTLRFAPQMDTQSSLAVQAGTLGSISRPASRSRSQSKELTDMAKACARLEHAYARPSSSVSAAKLALAEARALQENACHQVTGLRPADFAARIGERLAAVNSSGGGGAVSLEQALVEGVRFFPLVSSTQDKSVHPYVARSRSEFQSWNIGKQRASEWLRAVALRRQIESRVLLPSAHKLSTRYVFMWCRVQGHSRVILMGKSSPQCGVPQKPLALCGLCSRLLGNSDDDVHKSCRRQCLNNGLTLSSCQPLLKELALQQAALGHSQRNSAAMQAIDVVSGGPVRTRPLRLPTNFRRNKNKPLSQAPLFPRYWCREVLSGIRLADAVKPPLNPNEGSVMVPYPAEVALNAACQCMLRDLVTAACELAGSDSSSFNTGISPTLTVFHVHAALSRLSHLDVLTDTGLASLQL